jgi:hypothetical protein
MELDLGFGPVPGLEDEYPVEMDLEPEDEEPSVLEYARAYGLCRDYTQEQPVIDQIPTYDYQADLESPSDVPLANPAAELTKERLTISKETAFLPRKCYLWVGCRTMHHWISQKTQTRNVRLG